MYRLFLKILVAFACLLPCVSAVRADSTSSSLYSDTEQSVYQVRVINKQTGKKTTIGSGFVVMEPNLLATNYHVVSGYVNNSADYELDYLSTTGKTGHLELLSVDVVHDLAVLRADKPLGTALHIAKVPPKGAHLYSLGNPLDLGFSIVEGTNNGEMQSSDDNNILFSGSLNAGMSGGPTLDEHGDVIGVNVATSGNEISFLVPAQYLSAILERLKQVGFQADTDIKRHISEQLLANANRYMQRLQKGKWGTLRSGNFSVPGEIEGSVRCWDSSERPDPDSLLNISLSRCSNENSIFLDDNLEVGQLAYDYSWLKADALVPARFYRRYEALNSLAADSGAGKNDVTNFACHTDFTTVSGQDFKVTVCRRDYLHYAGLSDVLVSGALVGHKESGMLFNLKMNGVEFESGMLLLKRMLEGFKWQK